MATIYKSPLALAKSELYPKPTFDDNFYRESFKDGYKLKGNEARLGKGRLNYLIESEGVWNDNLDYAKAYLGYINPKDFISATLGGDDSIIAEELKNQPKLDLNRINNERQTPFLEVDFDNNKVVGHEGRHRLQSFINSGIERLPIVFVDRSPSFKKNNAQKKKFNGTLKGQFYDDDMVGRDIAYQGDLIPLNYKNIEDLYKTFGSED